MEATGEAMIISPRFNNILFESDGEMYLYLSLPIRRKLCKYFGHKDAFETWHCDRCHACLEHEKAECNY